MRHAALALLLLASPVLAGDPSWVLVANHLHSSAGGDQHWAAGIKHIREYCAGHGIAYGILTDHDTIAGWFDPEFTRPGPATLAPAEEWTSAEGHANIVGFSASGPNDAIKPDQSGDYDGELPGATANATPAAVDHSKMVAEVHRRGGLVIINHPALRGYRWPEDTFGADLCEVNGTWENPGGANAKAWYARQLAAGRRIGAVGGSDYHYLRPKANQVQAKGLVFPDIDDPINLVRVEAPGLPGLYAALRARHVQVLKHRGSPRCYVTADTTLDGKPDALAGDILTVARGTTVTFTIRVTGGKGRDLIVHDQAAGMNGHTMQRVPVTSDDFTTTLSRTASGAATNVTYFEVGKLETFVNPLWY